MMGAILFLLLALTIVFYCRWSSKYWSRYGIKGPNGMPIFGNMFWYMIGRRHYGHVYEDVYKTLPNASYIGIYRVLNEPAILCRDIEMIKEVMVKSFTNFSDNVLYVDENRDDLILHDPFVARGEKWKIMRSEIVPIFTPNKVKLSFPHIISICKKLDSFLKFSIQDKDFEAKDLCSKYTLDVIASAAFSLDGESFTNTNSDFTQLVEYLFMPNPISLIETTALLFLPKLGDLIKYRLVPKEIQNWLHSIIGKVLTQRKESTKTNHSDFLQWIIEAKLKAGEPIDDFSIVGHSSTFLVEGFETSASLMAFALYEFAVNPGIQEKIHNEIDAVLKKYNGKLSYEAMLELNYMEAAFYETLRLHPPLLALLKQCTKPFELPPQFKDARLQQKVVVGKGTVFVIPVHAVHKYLKGHLVSKAYNFIISSDPELYPEPSKFNPERFTEENRHQRPSCAYLGFGEGPRMCPGMRFGLAQSKAGLVTILSKYKVELSSKAKRLEVAPTTFVTSSLHGIWIKLKPRNI